MYRIKKTFEIAIAHKLKLPYESKCSNLHGHGMIITVHCASPGLNQSGMVIDFTEIKKKIHDVLDHKYLNDIEGIGYEKISKEPPEGVELNPTAERLAEWICNQFPECYRVDVQESEGNIATYEDESFWDRFFVED